MESMENILIKNFENETLAGIFHKANSNRLVILCHGMMCTKDKFFFPYLSEALAAAGFNVFRFDFAGNGESEGKFEDSTISKEIEDIASVVEFFKSKYAIACVAGHSKGGVDALLYQAKYNSASVVISMGSVADQQHETTKKYSADQIKEIDERGFLILKPRYRSFTISKKYFYDRLSYGNISNRIKSIKTRALIIHGEGDTEDPPESAKIISNAITGSTLKILPGADHFFTNKEKELAEAIVGWLRQRG